MMLTVSLSALSISMCGFYGLLMADKDPDEWTSITIRRRTYDRVKACKSGGETFDEVLTRLSADDENV